MLNEVFDNGKFSTALVVGFDFRWRKVQLPWRDVLGALDNVSATFFITRFATSAILQTKEAKMSLAQLVPALNGTTTVKVIKCLWCR